MTTNESRPLVRGGSQKVTSAATNSSVTPQGDETEFRGPLAGWCPPGGCPGWTPDKVAHAASLAYAKGYNDAREFLAETTATWRPLARKTHEEKVAERMAEMDATARRRAERLGYPYRIYPGGPVDWETGLPLQIMGVAA